MEMIRKGIDPFDRPDLRDPEGYTGYTRVSRAEMKENPYLSTILCQNAVVGIRSSIEVPRKFLGYFRYAHNFLIVVTPYLPIGLVRFLLGKWTTNPYSLWLRRAVTLKQYLRKVPTSLAVQARHRLTNRGVRPRSIEAGPCSQPEPDEYESDSYASDCSSDLD